MSDEKPAGSLLGDLEADIKSINPAAIIANLEKDLSAAQAGIIAGEARLTQLEGSLAPIIAAIQALIPILTALGQVIPPNLLAVASMVPPTKETAIPSTK